MSEVFKQAAAGRFALFCALLGLSILTINLVGLGSTMRHPEVDGYIDFAANPNATSKASLDSLAQLSATAREMETVQLVTSATRVVHEGMAHIDPGEVVEKGPIHFAMSVPITENWILFALRYLKPDTYRDYEFCSYQKAIERGTGRCGQQALALVSFLSAQGIPTGFVGLGGHAMATAEVSPGRWYILDPDYGGVIPFDINEAERDPPRVLEHYWKPQLVIDRGLLNNYLPDNEVRYGGVEARYGRACYIERAAYVLKWLVPFGLLLTGLIIFYIRRADRHAV